MIPIKIILLLAVVPSFALYCRFFRSQLRDRIAATAFFTLVVTAIIFPDLTTKAAHILGIGRGTDLTFYLFAVFSFFMLVLLYTKADRTSRQLSVLTRELAIYTAKTPQQQTGPR